MKSWIGPIFGLMTIGCMPAGGTMSETVQVDVADRERVVRLWTPTVEGPLDVVVVLDGERRFEPSARRISRLVRDGWIPPTAVVGVAAALPEQDFVPSDAGGASDEYALLVESVLPWVDETVGSEGRRVLVGDGLAGLATLWSSFQEPVIFDGFVAISPALYWSDGVIFDIEEERGTTGGDLPAAMYLAAGGRERWGAPGRLIGLAGKLSTRPYPSMLLGYEVIEGRSETTVFEPALDLGVTFALEIPEAAP